MDRELMRRAEKAAELWGQGIVTADDLVAFLHRDEINDAAVAGRAWWKAYTLGFANLRRHAEVADPGWRLVLRAIEGARA